MSLSSAVAVELSRRVLADDDNDDDDDEARSRRLRAALSDLAEATKHEPKNKDVRQLMEELKAAEGRAQQKEKGLFGGMFASKPK